MARIGLGWGAGWVLAGLLASGGLPGWAEQGQVMQGTR